MKSFQILSKPISEHRTRLPLDLNGFKIKPFRLTTLWKKLIEKVLSLLGTLSLQSKIYCDATPHFVLNGFSNTKWFRNLLNWREERLSILASYFSYNLKSLLSLSAHSKIDKRCFYCSVWRLFLVSSQLTNFLRNILAKPRDVGWFCVR